MPSRNVMPKFYKGQLHSGSKSGPVVRNLAQAKAIAASEQRNEKVHAGKYIHNRPSIHRNKLGMKGQ